MTTARRQEIEAIRTLVNLHDPDTQPDEWQPEDHAAAEAAAWALGPLLRRAARDADARDADRARRWARRNRKLSPPELIRAKREVRERAGGRCEAMTPVCSCRHEHTHHRRLRSQGGGHDAANLLAVCRPDHDYIHAHPDWARRHGMILGPGDDPATTPVVGGCPATCEEDHRTGVRL